MTHFIPLFPLPLVVYPGEKLNLHIFEPRYIQLITECHRNDKHIGIPSVINNQISELGTTVKILSIEQRYDDGSMDIKTEGQQVFKILETIKEIPDKLYSGAIVTYPENTRKSSINLMQKIMELIEQLHKQIGTTKEFHKTIENLTSYDVAHYIGMSLQDEYELLRFSEELHRQEYIKRHLLKNTPSVSQLSALQAKIQMNGHFKNIEGFTL